jgi:hypothetical protein
MQSFTVEQTFTMQWAIPNLILKDFSKKQQQLDFQVPLLLSGHSQCVSRSQCAESLIHI